MKSLNLEKTILIVDDEPSVLELLEAMIKGFLPVEIMTTTDAPKAIEILKKKNISIVITDINMPGMNGVDLLRNIHDLKKGTQVIVMTAGTTVINCIDCFRHGASDFLTKPFVVADVKEILNTTIKRLNRWEHFLSHRK